MNDLEMEKVLIRATCFHINTESIQLPPCVCLLVLSAVKLRLHFSGPTDHSVGPARLRNSNEGM